MRKKLRPEMPSSFSPKPLRVLVALVALSGLTGCDTLGARFRAREGVDLFHEGKFEAAATKFEEATKMDPNLPVLLLNQGTSSLAHFRAAGGKTPEGQAAATKAIGAYEKYLDKRPDDTRVKGALIQTFVETSRYEDAAVFFRPAVDKSPPDLEALTTMATIASKCSKPDEAVKWYQRRIAASPNKPDGYLALGVFLWQELHDHTDWPHDKRKPKAELAIEMLKKAIDLQPAAPNGYTYVNLVYRELAASEPSDDEKRKSLEEANRYFKLAAERQSKAG